MHPDRLAAVDERCGTCAGVMQHRKLKEPGHRAKRERVRLALLEDPGQSNRQIARQVGVSPPLVNRMRKQLTISADRETA